MELKWYTVYTRPRWEKKVAESLTLMRIENYCPLNKVLRQWSDRKKIVHVPLFTSYVFVKINEKQYEQVRRVDGILNFVYWQGKPGVIRDEEIDTIQRFLNEHQSVEVEKTVPSINDRVEISSGLLLEYEGRVTGLKNNRITVALSSLGYSMSAEVASRHIVVVNKEY